MLPCYQIHLSLRIVMVMLCYLLDYTEGTQVVDQKYGDT